MAKSLNTFDDDAVRKLAQSVREQQREIQSLKRSLAHLSVRRHEAVWMPPGGGAKLVELTSGSIVGSDKSTQALTQGTFYEQNLDGSNRVADSGTSHTAWWLSSWSSNGSNKGVMVEGANGEKFVIPIWGFISSPGGSRVYRPHAVCPLNPGVSIASSLTQQDYDGSPTQYGNVVTAGTSGDAGKIIINRIGVYLAINQVDVARASGTGACRLRFEWNGQGINSYGFTYANGERFTQCTSTVFSTGSNDTAIYVRTETNTSDTYTLNTGSTIIVPLFD